MKKQYRSLIDKRRIIEKKLNDNRYVELPYSGAQPFVFVSYSHRDKDTIFPVMAFLQRNSFRLWYDEGIEGGETWRKIIADKVSHCACVLLFCSEYSTKSKEVAAEISAALLCDKTILLVNLDDAVFDLEFNMYLSQSNHLDVRSDHFQEKLLNALPPDTKES